MRLRQGRGPLLRLRLRRLAVPVRIAFIGAGKVGCSLARYLGESGAAELAGFFSRTPEHAQEAAAIAGGAVFGSALEATLAADLVFITTPDTGIATAAAELAASASREGVGLAGKKFAHCSGALAADALAPLRGAGAAVASCHPLYAVSSRFDCWQELARAWFTLEGDDAAVETLEGLLTKCGNHVARIPADQKTRYHAAAVMASNLVVGLYETAASELAACGFSPADAERALAPLFLGNAEHIAVDGVAASLTGPAARGDEATVNAHLSCLCGDTKRVYELLTRVLYSIAGQN